MSAKTLIIATALFAASTAMTVPAFAAGGDGTGPNGNPPPAAQTLPVRAQVMFGVLDTNHDGAVDKDEFAVISTAAFSALDTDKDGKLTQDELRGRFGAMLGNRGNRGGRGGYDDDGRGWGQGRMAFNGPGRGAQGGPQGGPPNFADLDTNHDGSISQDEFNAARPGPGMGFGFGPRR